MRGAQESAIKFVVAVRFGRLSRGIGISSHAAFALLRKSENRCNFEAAIRDFMAEAQKFAGS